MRTLEQAVSEAAILQEMSALCAEFIERIADIEDRAHNQNLSEAERYAKRIGDAIVKVVGGKMKTD